VTRPRRSFGPNPPGRLAAAMLRALAAELADPGRFTRAKAYARDGAVIDIEIEPGVVRAEVQGSRYDPYITELHVPSADSAGGELVDLVPDRTELAVSCTCPDDPPPGGMFCKHGLAALLVLADEFTVEPDLLARWRSGGADDDRPRAKPRRPEEDDVDVLAPLLGAPASPPEPPRLPPRLPAAMPAAAGDAAAVLADALSVLRGLPT
jgi:uncharacterized Zn finger protein